MAQIVSLKFDISMSWLSRYFLLTSLGFAAIFFALGLLAGMAFGQQPGPGDYGFHHDQNFRWYKDLKTKTGGSCCTTDSVHDCRETRAKPFGKTWVVLIDGRWWPVPPEAVLPPEQNQNPFTATVCANRSIPPTIYCFLPKRLGG